MIDQNDNAGWGTFVSFKNGALILNGNAGALGWANITEPTKVFHWDNAARDYKSAGPAEALSKVEAGTWVFVARNKTHVVVGAAKEGRVALDPGVQKLAGYLANAAGGIDHRATRAQDHSGFADGS